MICNNCGNDIDEDSKYCKFCGYTLNKNKERKKKLEHCYECGYAIISNSKFCIECGSKIKKKSK